MIGLASLTAFGIALALYSATPGPGIAAIVARVVRHGWRSVLPLLVAIWVGDGA